VLRFQGSFCRSGDGAPATVAVLEEALEGIMVRFNDAVC